MLPGRFWPEAVRGFFGGGRCGREASDTDALPDVRMVEGAPEL